jgi:hypothetical protein
MDLNELAGQAGPPVIFMLAVWFLTLVVRRVMEHIWPRLANKGTWWSDIVLPSLPYALGVGFAVTMYKFPGLDKLPTAGTRALYGLVGGALSGLVYRIVKAVAKKKYGVELSMPPDAVAGAQVLVNVPENQLPKIEVHQAKTEDLPDSQKPTDPSIDAPEGDK